MELEPTAVDRTLDRHDAAVAAALFCAALTIRWLSLGGPVLGDESWYLYLARTFGTEPAAKVDHAWFHLANRPLFYAISHFGTYAGFAGFRWFGSVVSACSVVVAFGVARNFGAARWIAACTAAVLCVERPLVEYGSHGFPDPLASVFALAALWSANRQRVGATCALALCCVLCKESFVAVAVIATFVRLSKSAPKQLRPDAWAWITVLLPTVYVATITSIGSGQGIALQGWAQTLMSWKHARGMWVGPELWPGIAWCVWRRRWQWLAIWLGMPAFYVVWSFGLGRGIAPWYVIGPASLSSVAAALTFSDIASSASARRRPAQFAAFVACLLPVAWSGIFRSGSQVLALRKEWPSVDDAADVRALLEEQKPDRVLLVSCFWSYGYSHLRGDNSPANRAYWAAGDEITEVSASAHAAQITILCRSPESSDKEQRLAAQGFKTLLQTEDHWVLGAQPARDEQGRRN